MSQAEQNVLTNWVICKGARDVAAPYCVRKWNVGIQGPRVAGPPIPAQSLEHARQIVPPGLFCFTRSPEDDPVIVEVWM